MGRPLARTQPRSPVPAAGVHWKLRSRWPGRSLGISIPGESASESPVRPRERWAAAALTEPGTAQGHLPAGVLGGPLRAAGRAGDPHPRPRPPAPGSRPAVQGHVPPALSPVQSLPRGPAGPPDAAGPPPCLPRPAPRAVDGALGSGSASGARFCGFNLGRGPSSLPAEPAAAAHAPRASADPVGGSRNAPQARKGQSERPPAGPLLRRPRQPGLGQADSWTRTSIRVPHVDVHRGQEPDPNLHPCPPCGRPQRAAAGPEPPSVSPMWTSTEGSSAPRGQRAPAPPGSRPGAAVDHTAVDACAPRVPWPALGFRRPHGCGLAPWGGPGLPCAPQHPGGDPAPKRLRTSRAPGSPLRGTRGSPRALQVREAEVGPAPGRVDRTAVQHPCRHPRRVCGSRTSRVWPLLFPLGGARGQSLALFLAV